MAATTTIVRYTGTASSQVGNPVSTGTPLSFTRDDSNSGTTAIPIPTVVGTAYSQEVVVGLGITAAASPVSNISNRTLALSAAAPSGIYLFPKSVTDAVYTQGAAAPTNGGVAGAVPSGYGAALGTTPLSYDTSTVAGNVTQDTAPATANGAFQRLLLGVDQTIVTTGTVSLSVNLVLSYEEQ